MVLFIKYIMLSSINVMLFSTLLHKTQMTLSSFIRIVETTLDNIYDTIDKKEYSFIENMNLVDNVLTINMKGNKTYVLNIQKPTRQLWVSSPFSGPKRFEYNDVLSKWIDIHNDKISLYELINEEINKELIKNDIKNNKLKLL